MASPFSEPPLTTFDTVRAARAIAASPMAAGALIGGKYRIERELARGGIGIVLVAVHVQLGHHVAIKLLKPEVLGIRDLVERFGREAQVAAAIRSEHVARVFDVGHDELVGPYIVMELLEGEDLGTSLGGGPLLPELAIDYVIQACDALAEAHGLGIIHRDIKPENLFLSRRRGAEPIIKILDFGISKLDDSKLLPATFSRPRRVTEVGERFGTPVYMSPEQILSTGSVDLRTDIWALGVVLFELLTGDVPFHGESITQLAVGIASNAPTPLRARLPIASEALEAVVTKCLQKTPRERFRNVAELVEELARISPRSAGRAARVRELVMAGGVSVRPPRTFDPEARDVIVAGPVSASAARLAVTKAALPDDTSRRGRARLALALGAGVIAAVGSIALSRRKEPVAPVPSVAAVAVSIPTSSGQAEPSPLGNAAAERAADAVPVAVASPSTSVPTPRPSSHARAASVSPPAAVAPVTPPPAKPKSDYDEFGERR